MEKETITGVELTVVVPTRNRAALLGQALASLTGQTMAPGRFEVVVVNNGSTDDTAAVAGAFQDRHPGRVTVVNEPRMGLNLARNAGAGAAAGDIVVFFDDDARARPGWLQAFADCFRDREVSAAGGPIELEWLCPVPAWWESGLDHAMGRLDLGRAGRLEYPRFLYGMNLAVRRSVFSGLGLFREDLDRRGDELLAGGDTELCLRIWKSGGRIAYAPAAGIVHLVSSERANMGYIRRRSYWHGRSQRLLEHYAGWPWSKPLPLMPFILAKSLAGWAIRHRLSRTKQNELIFDVGYLVQGLKDMIRRPSVPLPPPLQPRPPGAGRA